MSRKGRVLVAMSGGIDSSVTALMLHEQGYDVVGMTMKTWDYATSGGEKRTTGCCSLDDINDARALAVELGFPHYILDIREEFGDFIIDNFVDEYLAGRTPNPCILCNTHIKWDALLKRADQLECEYIATGHYANIRHENERYIISKGKDAKKDQSYVLWGLKQSALARTIFPCGNFEKNEIRALAKDAGFEEIAQKSESYEICFVPDNNYRNFLKRRINGLEEKLKEGKFVDADGNILGTHNGYPFYTIGQRKGLGIAMGAPKYVTHIAPETNTVTLGDLEDLDKKTLDIRNINMIKYPALDKPTEAITKIRYKDQGKLSEIVQNGDEMKITFYENVKAIAPGQSAVCYEGDDVLGGGFIKKDDKLILKLN